jgi:AAA domain
VTARRLRAVPMPARDLPTVLNIAVARAVDTGEPEFVIDGLYPVGLTMVVAAAKAGKTTLAFQVEHWFSLGMRIGTSQLGQAEGGRALIIDFEGRGQLANSQSKRIAPFGSLPGDTEHMPTLAELADPDGPLVHHCEWPGETFDARYDHLAKWLWEAQEAGRPIRLVRIDTMREMIGATPPGLNLYQHEHACLNRLNRLGEEMGAAIVVLHHVNKAGEISGSTGIRGAANAIYVLDHPAGEPEGVLRCDGNRYGPPKDWPLVYDLAAGTWQFSDALTLAQVCHTGTQRRILDHLMNRGPSTGPELRAALPDVKPDTAKKAMTRLHRDGWIRRRDDATWIVIDPGTGEVATPAAPMTGWPAGTEGEAAQHHPRGVCEVCQEPMTILTPGQTAHPGCEPAGAPAPAVQAELPGDGEDQADEPEPATAAEGSVTAPAGPAADLGKSRNPAPVALPPARNAAADARRDFLASAQARKVFSRADQYEALERALAAIDAGTGPERLRILAALEGSHGDAGPFAPLRARRQPYWAPELPAIAEAAHIVAAWNFSRDGYTGPATTLDANAAWPTATSSVVVAHGQLDHTGAMDLPERGLRPGYYQMTVYPWTEPGMPSPLAHAKVGADVVVPAPTAALLRDLAAAGRWPDAAAADSWTGDPCRLAEWARLVRELRRYVIDQHEAGSAPYDAVKTAFGQALGLMTGSWAPDSTVPRREWRCKCRRVDWVHHIRTQAAATLWRRADRCHQAAPEYGPLALRNIDELVLPDAALEAATAEPAGGGSAPVTIDQTRKGFGTFKVKSRDEKWSG